MDCSLPGSSIHGIFQARILDWVAISFSRRSSWPRDWTRVSHIVGRRFTVWAGTRDQIANIRWIVKKQDSSRKVSTSASLTMGKPLTVWITKNCGKFLKRWDYKNTSSFFWETCMQVKKQQLKLDMEQQTGSKFGKEYKAVYYHSAYLT